VEYTLPERPLLPGDLHDVGTFAPPMPPEGRSDLLHKMPR